MGTSFGCVTYIRDKIATSQNNCHVILRFD